MNRLLSTALATGLALAAADASAFSQETHKRIVIDAVNYMNANPDTTNYNKLAAAAAAAGYTVEQMANVLGQGAYDVDDFMDTYFCGATTGDCQTAPVWGLGAGIVKYTSWWHFQNHTRGSDAHGNDKGGYNYDQLRVWGTLDDMAASWLVGDYLDDGKSGMKGWFGDNTKYNTYGVTEANYRQGSSSSKSQYDDFEEMPFQPIDNLGQYWYTKFQQSPTFQTLGFVLHTTDLLQPHHTWTTSALNHAGWETWVNDYYYSEGLNERRAGRRRAQQLHAGAGGQHRHPSAADPGRRAVLLQRRHRAVVDGPQRPPQRRPHRDSQRDCNDGARAQPRGQPFLST